MTKSDFLELVRAAAQAFPGSRVTTRTAPDVFEPWDGTQRRLQVRVGVDDHYAEIEVTNDYLRNVTADHGRHIVFNLFSNAARRSFWDKTKGWVMS